MASVGFALLPETSRSFGRARAAVVVLLLGAYALPLFLPPQAVPLEPPVPETSLVERLFPGVPPWWVIGRLLCLLAAVLVAATGVRTKVFLDVHRVHDLEVRAAPAFLFAAAAVAAAHVVAAYWAPSFSRPLQVLYVAVFGLPPLIIWLGEWQRGRASDEAAYRVHCFSLRSACALAGLLGMWVAWRVPVTWRSLRGVDFVDANPAYDRLVEAARGAMNLVSSGSRQSSIHLVFQGAGLVGPNLLLDWAWLQAVAVFWLLISALGIAYLGTRLVSRWGALVAVAAFLFSPFVLSVPFSVVPLGLGPAFTAALLSLMLVIERTRRPSAIAALGAVAGLGVLIPPITPMAVAVVAVCGCSWWLQRPRGVGLPLAVGALSIWAALVPAVPTFEQLRWMAVEFSSASVPWSVVEAVLFGQVSLAGGETAFRFAEVAQGDLLLGALLSPFAIPRTAIRLWGDALFDPVGAGLAAVGLAVGALSLWRDRTGRILLLLLLISLLVVAPSTYDRPSLARMVTAPVVLALFSGAGFERLRRLLGAGEPAPLAILTVAAIAVGGGVLFDQVNPRILARSALGISLTALEGTPPSGAVILAHEKLDPQWSSTRARVVPLEPRTVAVYTGPATLDVADGLEAPAVLLWSPGLEDEAGVSAAICRRWPSAALYTLYDPARLSRAFGASPHGRHWQPALPQSHWKVAGCETPLETESKRAAAALATATALRDDGRHAEAVDGLRRAARGSFAQPALFMTLAELLLQQPGGTTNLGEVIYWARRATRFKNAKPGAFAILAAAYARSQRFDEAAVAARQGAELARRSSDHATAAELEEHSRSYERRELHRR